MEPGGCKLGLCFAFMFNALVSCWSVFCPQLLLLYSLFLLFSFILASVRSPEIFVISFHSFQLLLEVGEQNKILLSYRTINHDTVPFLCLGGRDVIATKCGRGDAAVSRRMVHIDSY